MRCNGFVTPAPACSAEQPAVPARRYTMRRSRRFAFLAVVIVAAALLGFASPAAADPQNYSYVGLGDSYTSGPLIPQQQTNPIGCLRSNQNYPNQVFPYLGLPVFRDASCSGARTVHMTESQS